MSETKSKSDTSNMEQKEDMNRFKFRAWNKRTQSMNYYVEIYCYTDGSVGCSAGENNNFPIGRTENFILMQFTGLTDIEGKECFDNDIIINKSRNGGAPHIIKWSKRYAAWVGDYGIEYLIAEEMDEIIKVGNNYQHPQLLTQK